jgi:hypothetical protein
MSRDMLDALADASRSGEKLADIERSLAMSGAGMLTRR